MFRTETDLIGSMKVPADKYYGIHTLRAVENFTITGRKIPETMVFCLARIKKACALANADAGTISSEIADAICRTCDEILDGRFLDQFIVDPVQGGAGTSTNMNANEVIANRAIEILGGDKGNYGIVHPNDHVNCGQSTNDVYPTAIRLALYSAVQPLTDALGSLIGTLNRLAVKYTDTITLGRTQLQDAVPLRAGRIFGAWASVIERERTRIRKAAKELLTVNLGGTAIGTGINASPVYLEKVIIRLKETTGLEVSRSADCVDATQNADSFVSLSSALKSCSTSLSKICNDLRLRSSGPYSGLGDLVLPPRQNGSSIMPGKVNPVIPEVVNQIAFRIIGFDTTVTMAAEAGQMELNAFEPIIFDSLWQGCTQLTNGICSLNRYCLKDIRVNEARCSEIVEHSSALATALCPQVGYTRACHLAREAQKEHDTVSHLAVREGLVSPHEADVIFNPKSMTDVLCS